MMLSVQPFLEPRGFIRALEFVFSIAAFATVTNFGGTIGFDVVCPDTKTTTPVTLSIPYPFHMGSHVEPKSVCGKNVDFRFFGNFASDAQFFVATGVLSMLWAMIGIAIYLTMDQTYRVDKRLKYADFGITLLLATFWIAGSAAWANGLHGLKNVVDPGTYIHTPQLWNGGDLKDGDLTHPRGGNFAPLTISVLLGFLNFILWAGNTWFLYKEIKEDQTMNDSPQQSVPPAVGP